MTDLLAVIGLGIIFHLGIKLLILMKLSELNGRLSTVSSQLTTISTQLASRTPADAEIPAETVQTLNDIEGKVSVLVTDTANPS